ncbi:LppY/LpqO family protein [Streptomyces sp. NBC_00557]|uniref:LppY/LpqO family protein n=1 Tax=Streptomyces sp. NBC_00557 TaxID=2975776 RepID=UPI002E8177B6|nr:DUF1259 domain-containing protein [Streptomyces sp. NBC_00557]WUC36050.1 DUF1259 domain-containing protein [Streptomyces sp. NBC_00557]
MVHRKPFRRPATTVAAVAAGAATLATALALTLGSASGRPPGTDWNAVGRAIGQPLTTEAQDVHTAEWLRTDLHVVNAGVTENPAMELNAEASFHPVGDGRTLLIGEVTLTDGEVGTVVDRLQRGGVEVTALHKHLQGETPRLWWLHYWALGDAVRIARTVHGALATTGIPLSRKTGAERPIALDVAGLDRVIGTKGENENGVLQYHVPVSRPVADTRAGTTLPYLMEASTLLMFQPLGGGRAAVNGDFTMTAGQVNPVVRALRAHGVTVIELHNHLLYEQPRLFYLHFWKTGDATTLAHGLRAGLDRIHAPRG